jgi:hypothetical protein
MFLESHHRALIASLSLRNERGKRSGIFTWERK